VVGIRSRVGAAATGDSMSDGFNAWRHEMAGGRIGAVAVAMGAFLALGVGACEPGASEGARGEATREWQGPAPEGEWTGAVDFPTSAEEPRFRSLRKLTHGGTNAEAYFSPDGERLVFQATWPGVSGCDQIYSMRLDGSGLERISTGDGRTTCGFFMDGGDRVLFSSTHHVSEQCPTPPDRSRGYLWGLFPFDVFVRDLATGELRRLTDSPGYDAEATLSPDGETIVFTSDRSGDLNLWTMSVDGSDLRQITDREGYQGGAFFSPDGSMLVYRAHYPRDDEERTQYRSLLADQLVAGGRLEVYVSDADGSNERRITDNGAANFAPYFHPNGRQIIFSSNLDDPGGRNFDLYLINLDGTGLERITNSPGFDGFPMFSPDGRHLVFASSRGGEGPGEINVYLAEWVEEGR
jgi:TolB protein